MTAVLLTAPDPSLGGDVRAELWAAARAWAGEVAPGCVGQTAAGPGLAGSARAALGRHGAPLLLASAGAPRMSAAHARLALGDLAGGADASFGPGMDGGWYLAALAGANAAVLEVLDAEVPGEDVMTRLLGLAAANALDIGLLRMERLLRTPHDLAAAAADPLTGDRLTAAIRRMGYRPHHAAGRDADV